MNLKKYQLPLVVFFLSCVSAYAFFHFYQSGQHLLYADAMSRLNIARKVMDNLTPGLAQLGNVWLPLPQVVMFPFIWNDFLWHSGIAGSISSMTAFIVGGVYVYKATKLLTNSFVSSLCSVTVYALNINILYLQSTAMSEALFVCTLAATIYYFLLWLQTNSSFYLIPCAIAVSAMTLTRYEGLAILFSSVPMVYLYTLIHTKKPKKAEAHVLLYVTLAGLGFALWTLYLTVIFGDPLYWKNFYTAPVHMAGGRAYYSQAKPFLIAVWQYTTSTVWMVGLIPFVMSLLGVLVLLVKSIRDKSWYILPLLMPTSIFLFMVLTLQRNTPIVQPSLTWEAIRSSKTSFGTGFNIRYGLLLLPWVAIMASYVLHTRHWALTLLVFSLFGIQVYSYLRPEYSVIYQIPARIYNKPYRSLVVWMKQHYDGGPILISASSHEDQMFEMGFKYKTFIHEGTNKYWKETLDDPPRYARWVILDKGHPSDRVARKKNIETVLYRDYNLVYSKEQVKIFRIKKKPYIELSI